MRPAGTCLPRYLQILRENFRRAADRQAPPSNNSGCDDCALNCTAQPPNKWPSLRTVASCRSGYGCSAGGPTLNRARDWLLRQAWSPAGKAPPPSPRRRTRGGNEVPELARPPRRAVVCSVQSYRYLRQSIEYTVPAGAVTGPRPSGIEGGG